MELNVNSAKEFNVSLKQAIKKVTGLKVSVNIINSYNFPHCWVRIMCDTNVKFNNEFRLKVFDSCGLNREHLLNTKDVYYGNIRSNMISTHVPEWVKVFDDVV